jgi:hypothetical protein
LVTSHIDGEPFGLEATEDEGKGPRPYTQPARKGNDARDAAGPANGSCPAKCWVGLFLARQEYFPENRDNTLTGHFQAGAALGPNDRVERALPSVGRTLGFSDGRAYKLQNPHGSMFPAARKTRYA